MDLDPAFMELIIVEWVREAVFKKLIMSLQCDYCHINMYIVFSTPPGTLESLHLIQLLPLRKCSRRELGRCYTKA